MNAAEAIAQLTDPVKGLPLLWIVETGAGAWSTNNPETAAKHLVKPGSIVTPYWSQKP